LIPHGSLTFSGHDNIQLSNEEFLRLLTDPKNFLAYWRRKRQRERVRDKKRLEAINKRRASKSKKGESPTLLDMMTAQDAT
jgi:hypothetical protein